MALPLRVSIPGGSYACGPPYQRYDDADVKLRWISESLILKDKHPDRGFDALPHRTCADATRTRVVLARSAVASASPLVVVGTPSSRQAAPGRPTRP